MLVIFLLVTTFTAPKVYAENTVTISTSNYREENLTLQFNGSNIIISNLPSRNSFDYIMIRLYDENIANYNDATSHDIWTTRQNEILYSTKDVSDGTYYIEIFYSSKQYSYYSAYIWGTGGIKVEIKGGKVTPIYAIPYKNNKSIYDGYSNDPITLQYYLQPSYGVESTNKTIINLAKSIVSESDSDYEKIRKVHDWVANNIWYNWDGYRSGNHGDNSALGVYKSKKAVCQGYANLTAAILRALGFSTKVVTGYALGAGSEGKWSQDLIDSDESNHAWNEVYSDNRWIIIDTTWDSNNKFENGKFSEGTGLDNYRYFDPTIEIFSTDHKMFDSSDEVIDHKKNLDYFTLDTKNITLYTKGKEKTKKLYIDIDYKKIQLYEWEITFKSNNKSVATVSKNGSITAKKKGKATITATVKVGTFTKEFKVKVTVK